MSNVSKYKSKPHGQTYWALKTNTKTQHKKVDILNRESVYETLADYLERYSLILWTLKFVFCLIIK